MTAWRWLGRVPYERAHAMQRSCRERVIRGGTECVLLLEHEPVVTTGRRTVDLPDVGVPVVETERGGLATWHGPGQLVGYPILDLGRRGIGVRAFVHGMERVLIESLSGVGVSAHVRDGFPGVWTESGKVASVGIHVRRGVTMHGFALNLNADLTVFERFTPCGIEGVRMVNALPNARSAILSRFAAVVGRMLIARVDTLGALH